MVSGLQAGQGSFKHGLHVHDHGITTTSDVVVEYCTSAGAHFNPQNKTHGSLTSAVCIKCR